MLLKTVPKAKELLQQAIGEAERQAKATPQQRSGLFFVREKEARRIRFASELLQEKLGDVVASFPDIDAMHSFHREMLGLAISIDDLRKNLGHLQATKRLLKKIAWESIGRVHKVRDAKGAAVERKAFFGRAKSLMAKAEKSLERLESARREFKEVPSISTEEPTAIIAGYPNVGKTTLLKRLTGSSPEIAAYPFTTKELKIGHFQEKFLRFQLVDTPGLLDRPLEKRNPIEKKAIAALRHLAHAIVFVADASQQSGYSIEKQFRLLAEIKRLFPRLPVVVALNKCDLASGQEIEEAKKIFGDGALTEGEGMQSGLKEKIAAELKKELLRQA